MCGGVVDGSDVDAVVVGAFAAAAFVLLASATESAYVSIVVPPVPEVYLVSMVCHIAVFVLVIGLCCCSS